MAKAKKKKEYKIFGYGAMDDEYVRRAMAAWLRGGKQASMPANDSVHCEYEGKEYVVLNNVNGVLGVYRIRNDGLLKRLKRWPVELEDY